MSWVAVAIGGSAILGGVTANNQRRASRATTRQILDNQLDPLEIALGSLELQMDYAPQLLELEQQLQPGYAQLGNDVLGQQLLGGGTQFDADYYLRENQDLQGFLDRGGYGEGLSDEESLFRHYNEYGKAEGRSVNFTLDPNSLLGIQSQIQPHLSEIQANANTAQRRNDINDVAHLGSMATDAWRSANPELLANTSRLADLVESQGGQTFQASGSSLMPDLEAAARDGLSGPSELQAELQRQAMAALQTEGALSADARRDVEQSVRAAAADRGMAFSNSTIFDEAMNKDKYRRQRSAEDKATALAVDAAGQRNLNANRSFALGVSSQGNNLSQFNANLSRLQANDQFGREFALQNVLQSQALDPYQMVLGRGSAPNAGAGAVAQAGGINTGQQYSSLFDPTLSSIFNTNMNAQNSALINQNNNNAALTGGFLGNMTGLLGDWISTQGGGG